MSVTSCTIDCTKARIYIHIEPVTATDLALVNRKLGVALFAQRMHLILGLGELALHFIEFSFLCCLRHLSLLLHRSSKILQLA